jgi:hypothetical protein
MFLNPTSHAPQAEKFTVTDILSFGKRKTVDKNHPT